MTESFSLTIHYSPLTIRYPFFSFSWLMVTGECMENGKRKMVNGFRGGF
jgi:hypothetical protein